MSPSLLKTIQSFVGPMDGVVRRDRLCHGIAHRHMTMWIGSMTLFFCLVSLAHSSDSTILIDNFDDGDDEGWTHLDFSRGQPWGPGMFDASSGAYHLKTTGVLPRGTFTGLVNAIWDGSSDPLYSDGFLRATIQAGNGGSGGGFLMRYAGGGPPSAYIFGADPSEGNFFFNAVQNGSFVRKETFEVPGFPVLAGEDWIVEAGTVGDQITMKAWPIDQSEPAEPQLQLTDSRLSHGVFGISAGVNLLLQEPWQTSAVFDDIVFTFPDEPSEPGDFNRDGLLDVDDLDALTAAILAGSSDAQFDLDGNLSIDGGDRSFWISDLKETYFGDTDLNGQVNANDLNMLALNWRTDNATSWSQGDFNGDGDVNASDLNDLGLNWRSGVIQAASAAAVPEPSSIGLLLLELPILVFARRTRLMTS